MIKTRSLIIMMLVVLFGATFGNISFAQNQNMEIGEEESLLKGLRNDDNYNYRKHHFQEQVRNLYRAEPPEDKDILIVEDFGFAIDDALGIDFPQNKKEDLLTFQYSMLKQKSSLDVLYKESVLDEETYIEKLSRAVEQNLKRSANLLNDEEFEILFGIFKTDIDGIFYEIANIGRPDNQKIIDKR